MTKEEEKKAHNNGAGCIGKLVEVGGNEGEMLLCEKIETTTPKFRGGGGGKHATRHTKSNTHLDFSGGGVREGEKHIKSFVPADQSGCETIPVLQLIHHRDRNRARYCQQKE